MYFNIPVDAINCELRLVGSVHFKVLRPTGTALAAVTLEGNHRIELSATVYPNNGDISFGQATLFRHRENDLTAEAIASAFGSAYVRATDPRYSDPSAKPLPTGPIEVGDFVKVRTALGERRGVVLDVLSSARKGTVSVEVRTPDEKLVTPVGEATLIAKGK